MRDRISILGVEVDALTLDQAIAEFERMIAARCPSLAFSFNVDICMKIRRDAELRDIYREANLVLVDGTPMMWAASLLGTPLPGRVSGSDLLPAFCRVAAKEGYRVFLLGARPGVADLAGARLVARNPGLRIVGVYSPPFGFEQDISENARAIDAVRREGPDVLFVALGAPKQEKWLYRFRDDLGVPVSMGVGSALDYLAGRLRRAPNWMQRLGLEWTYRLAQEPGRLWRRYLLDDSPFVYHVLVEWLQRKLTSSSRRSTRYV